MSDSSAQHKPARTSARQLHRREMRVQVWLPFALALGLVAGMFLLVALPSEPAWRLRAAFIADVMTTLLLLCPLFLCGFVVYVLLVASAYGMHRLYHGAVPPLERLSELSEKGSLKVQQATEQVNEQTSRWSVWLAPWLRILGVFDEAPIAPADEDRKNTPE